MKKKIQAVGSKLKSLRHTIRTTMGLQKVPYRERLLETVGNRQRQTQRSSPQQETPQQGTPQVQERFAGRPRILDMFLSPSQPEQPQFTPEELVILEEREKQLVEDTELRKQQEEKEREDEEKRKALKRAREKMSFGNL